MSVRKKHSDGTSWHAEAREMRAAGAKLAEIGQRFQVTPERARQVCVGVKCPVDHRAANRRAMAKRWSDPAWRAAHLYPPPPQQRPEADFITAHYGVDMSAREIGARVGLTKNAVIGLAYRLGLQNRQVNTAHKNSSEG